MSKILCLLALVIGANSSYATEDQSHFMNYDADAYKAANHFYETGFDPSGKGEEVITSIGAKLEQMVDSFSRLDPESFKPTWSLLRKLLMDECEVYEKIALKKGIPVSKDFPGWDRVHNYQVKLSYQKKLYKIVLDRALRLREILLDVRGFQSFGRQCREFYIQHKKSISETTGPIAIDINLEWQNTEIYKLFAKYSSSEQCFFIGTHHWKTCPLQQEIESLVKKVFEMKQLKEQVKGFEKIQSKSQFDMPFLLSNLPRVNVTYDILGKIVSINEAKNATQTIDSPASDAESLVKKAFEMKQLEGQIEAPVNGFENIQDDHEGESSSSSSDFVL